jgi:ribonuclease Y
LQGATITAIAVIGIVLGAVIGYLASRRREKNLRGPAEARAQEMLNAARNEADTIKRQAELEAKEVLLEAKTKTEEQTKAKLKELQEERSRLLQREEAVDSSADELRAREGELSRKERDLDQREEAAEAAARNATDMLRKAEGRLEQLAGLTADQARNMLVEQLQEEAQRKAASEIAKIERETEQIARERSVTMIATAIQRHASEYVAERTVSVVQLPSDELKGRIIGREGRNIRALEAATGVDLIIDDTPEAVILSCFNPVRREVARLALTRLLTDGRIHPSRIEEVVKRCQDEVQAGCKEAGEQAVFDLGLHRVHPELIKLVGELRFRSSYAQNLLQHSVEVGHLAGAIATELGASAKLARRAGLLHDIGKAVPHEVEGSHATVGANLAKKYGENNKVVHAIEAHHGDVEPNSLLAHIVDAANRLSAQRPGARRDRLQSYVQRLEELENICVRFDGVSKAHAIQAGREVRVVVENDKVSDDMALMMSKDIAKQVEEALTYPAQIKVCVIRESRATSMAR